MIIVNIALVAFLIICTSFFVITEFAIIKVRPTRIDQLIAEGNKKAISAKKVISSLDEYLSATQLGITIASLGLGWLGDPTIQALLAPLLNKLNIPESATHAISFVIALSLMTFLSVVLGELTPKTFAIHKAEAVTLRIAKPIIIFHKVMYPFIKILNSSANLIARSFGLKPASEGEMAHSEEELRIILTESYEKGQINQSEYKYVDRIFDFDNRIAKEIMVPRTEIISISIDDSWDDIFSKLQHERYTRYPVIDGDKDSIVGVVHLKDLISVAMESDRSSIQLDDYIHPIISVIETIPINDLLIKMQKERNHMALLFDEYGGTAGIVTAEDIIEEIVGEIRDEFDIDEIPEIRKIAENHYIVDSKLLLEELNTVLSTDLEEEGIDTIGGWLLTKEYDLHLGDSIEDSGYIFTVNQMDGHHIQYIEIKKDITNNENM
ncbi:hemolysin family protein [Bacillus massiliigorillae]|uniref:hemolysin family protein n=1 Tax=Bacillus massiliigorillae TaxID=1243664 RepID=UPI0005A71673|nr:hemolysin family protein [Bacillus massiliigorillae]